MQSDKPELQHRIKSEGWGNKFLSKRLETGHWGQSFYQPKWISTHYTLLDLKNLAIEPTVPEIQETLDLIIKNEKGKDGGILPIGTTQKSDVCVNGMFLNYATYFRVKENHLTSIIDFLLAQQVHDGGFNCQFNRKGCVHSSLHSTLSVIEGILEYAQNGYSYRLNELKQVTKTSREFILMHRLFKSDKTGNIIDKKMTLFSYPCRWYYDIFRALDYFQKAAIPYDTRMNDAREILLEKRNKDGKWLLQGKHPGQMHFDMEQIGKESRWNTLRALRILKSYNFIKNETI